MPYNPEIHHRRSIRLKGYDYNKAGLYFVTICTQNRECLFGDVFENRIQLNNAGEMIEKWWFELPHKFKNIQVHELIVMPNHIHGIVQITTPVGADLSVCPEPNTAINFTQIPFSKITGAHIGAPLHTMVQWFKTMTTNNYIQQVKSHDWKRFDGKLWQRNYHEHIIRDEIAYLKISKYIQTNPQKWSDDLYFQQAIMNNEQQT